MSAIPASSVSMKTMADGTLRITFDVEPGQAQDAFRLFAAPGTQVAIAALKDGSFLEQPVVAIPITEPKPREQLGDACYRTVMWCQEPSFWAFLNHRYAEIGCIVTNAKEAGDVVKHVVGVTSRKDLDTDNEANKAWHRLIREPYSKYLKSMERVAA